MSLKQSFSSFGFSLIELLVVISILAVVAGLTIPSFGEFQKRQELTQTGKNLITSLRLAQSQAFGGVKNKNCSPSTQLIGWYIRFESVNSAAKNAYTIVSRCLGVDEVRHGERIVLPVDMSISYSAGPVVLFQPVNKDAVFLPRETDDPASSPLETRIVLSRKSQTFVIIVRRTGDIVEATAN